VAAAVVLVPVLSQSLRAVVFDERSHNDYSAAPLRAADTDAAPERAHERNRARTRAPEALEPAVAPPDVEPEPQPETKTDEVPPRSEPTERVGTAPPTNMADRLADLDARARAAWKSGDLATAQQTFGKLVRIGGRRDIVELAFGDLFSVARQRGDATSLRRYWRAYAARFPDGHYTDDARAGLCRTSSGDRKLRCWRDYLRDRPAGTYRRDAEAAIDAAGGGDGSSALRCREDGGRVAALGACNTVDGGSD
jgi:hypothetical protein